MFFLELSKVCNKRRANMKTRLTALATLCLWALPALASAMPTVYPRGTTIFDPSKTWSGYTVITAIPSAYQGVSSCFIVDMNGNKVHEWPKLLGFPNKVFPDGVAMGTYTSGPGQNNNEVVVMDFDGKELWKFDDWEDYGGRRSARQHHDYQVSGNPTGYYAPGQTPTPMEGKILVLSHTDVTVPEIGPNLLEDDVIYEVDVKTKKILWQWQVSSAFDQLGFDDAAKAAIAKARKPGGAYDWMHINNVNYVGPNKWWDEDPVKYAAFNPENIIWDSRSSNIIAITDRKGDIVWKVGPDYRASLELRNLGQIIGQHHAHMIPKGLPGEGNILVFDNGGSAGYGEPTAMNPTGVGVTRRAYSRVVEFDPTTLKIVWEYSHKQLGGRESETPFFSSYISSAQRLPNGNTLITEGAYSRVFEVTPDHETVWEYIGPAGLTSSEGGLPTHTLYRAYRIPYEWVPQLQKPVEKAVVPAPEMDSRLMYIPK